MGLDISYASRINFEKRREPDFEEMHQNSVFLYPNDSLLDQSEGIKAGEYICEGVQGSFRAGSYSGYGSWRKMLSELIGWEIEDLWRNVATLAQRSENLNDVLSESDELKVDIPFIELLHFSDCEGFIGPKTSAKLHVDFLEWDEKARNFRNYQLQAQNHFYEKYQEWTEAFKVASDGGCVIFC